MVGRYIIKNNKLINCRYILRQDEKNSIINGSHRIASDVWYVLLL